MTVSDTIRDSLKSSGKVDDKERAVPSCSRSGLSLRALSARSLALLMLSMSAVPASTAEYLCRDVGRSWTWFSDHLAASVDHLIVGAPGRRYEAATGMSIGGSPWGWRDTHSGETEVTAWGMGALHIRQDDDGIPFKVCATATGITAITIIDKEF